MDDNKYKFRTLTPISDMKLKIYSNALNFAMETPTVKNIAITGSYGSGKSSIIETYKTQNDRVRFLHISLAHFNPVDISDETLETDLSDEQKPISDRLIEGKIINQLIHQTDPNKIFQTDFKIKTEVPLKFQIIYCFASIVVILALLHMILFGIWSNLVNSLSISFFRTIFTWSTYYDSLLLSGTFCLLAIIYIVHKIIKTQKYRKTLKKISLQGCDIEIFSEEKDSYFDKYLNEILYLFDNCEAHYIVFEDMDRYNSNHIFEKLREMNTLINNRPSRKDRPLKFLYLLRDDIFSNKDRTKFFDYIIPVVPVIDGSNSLDKFLLVFKEAGIKNQFKEAFLSDLSLYVDDMRILKNVCNEYIIYSEQISEIELDKEKLLAILVYKNLFPRDFNALQLRKGYVYNLFAQKEKLIKLETENINTKIVDLENLIQAVDKEILENIDELDALYLPWNFAITQINGRHITREESRIKLIKKIKENPNSYLYGSGHNQNLENDLAKLEEDPCYKNRKKIIEAKKKIDDLKNYLYALKHQSLILQNQSLKDIIPLVTEQDVFAITYENAYVISSKDEFESVKDSSYFDLIIYLVRNGYLDESYSDYMTYFYPESITANDKNFLRSITDHKKKEYTYSLDDPSKVLSRLQAITFNQIEVLNYDLIDELLVNIETHEEHISFLIKQLEEKRIFDYIASHWENGKEKTEFIHQLNHHWPNVFSCIISDSTYSDKQKHQYAIDTLYYSPQPDIERVNDNNNLKSYISDNSSFLDIKNADVDKIINGLVLLGVRFRSIDYASSNKELFDEVYKRNMYLFNLDNIISMLRNVYGVTGEDIEIIQRSFTLIYGKHKEPLAKYVESYIEQHLVSVLNSCKEVITDNEEIAIKIINHSGIADIELKKTYIKYLETPINDIKTINDKLLWPVLLDAQVVLHSDSNILNYYFLSGNKLDQSLIKFINSQMPEPSNFENSRMEKEYGKEPSDSFELDIINCNDIKNEQYQAIVRSFHIYYSEFMYTKINLEKILILINLNIIIMTKDELIFIRKEYKKVSIKFIVHNIDVYMKEVIDNNCFEHDEMLLLLLEPISEQYKVDLLKFSSNVISVRDKDYSEEVLRQILNHNYDRNDLGFLINSFTDMSESIQEIVITKCCENIGSVISIGKIIDPKLYNALISNQDIPVNSKVELLAMQIPNLSIKDILKSLNSIGLSDYCGLFNRKQAVVEDNRLNRRILEIFKTRDWNFKSEMQDDGKIRIYGKNIKS